MFSMVEALRECESNLLVFVCKMCASYDILPQMGVIIGCAFKLSIFISYACTFFKFGDFL